MTDYNAGGLLVSPANMVTSFGTGAEGPGPYSQNCYYYSQYQGTKWVPDTQPICGPLVPTQTPAEPARRMPAPVARRPGRRPADGADPPLRTAEGNACNNDGVLSWSS